MSIDVEDRPRRLLGLLYLREVLDFADPLDIPGVIDRFDIVDRATPASYPEQWQDAYEQELTTFESDGALDPSEGLPRELPEGLWLGLPLEPFETWIDALEPESGRRLIETPEYTAGPVMVSAWRSGLRRVVTLPLKSSYSRMSRTSLVLSASTREDALLYAAALRTWIERVHV